jgi:hypothetical protein
MKTTTLIFLAVFSLLLPASAQTENSKRPLLVPISIHVNGPGQIVGIRDGQMLEPWHNYVMVAVPDRGHTFTGWSILRTYTSIDYMSDESGVVTATTNIVSLPVTLPKPDRRPMHNFLMVPEQVLLNGGSRTVSVREDWVANFSPSSHFF